MAGPNATVTRTNVLAGPGALYSGLTTATIPADTAVNAAPAVSAGWTDAGGTDDGLTVTVNQSFFEMRVDQIPDIVGRRLTERDVQVTTNLAEGTLENLAVALNDTVAASGAGFKKIDLVAGQAAMFPTYRSFLIDGWAPATTSASKRRRVVVRRALSIENVETAYKKDEQYLIPVTFGAEFVDSTTSPVTWIDEV